MSTENINIEKIMEEIRQEIQEKGYTNDLLSFEDVVAFNAENKSLEEYFELLNNSWYIQPHKMLQEGGGVSGKIKVFIKKVLRKSIKFYIEPIVADQNEFNANTTRLLNMVSSYMELSDKKIEMLEKEIERLKRK